LETSIDEPPSQLLLMALSQDSAFMVGAVTLLVVLLCLSAMVSGSEVAFFSMSPEDLSSCKESKRASDRHILYLVKKPRKLLATILILNNFVNVAIVTLSTVMMWQLTAGQPDSKLLTFATPIIVTFTIVFFGEVIPKVYAIQNNLQMSRFTSRMLRFSQVIFTPLIYLLLNMSKVIERRIQKKGYDVSIEEVNLALALATEGPEATDEEKDILKGIVNFGMLTARQIMKSRIDITAVDIDINFHELMDKINKSGFSRIPVFRETIDKIEGTLYVKDILPHIENDEHFKWQELIRPGFFIPETKKIDTLLKDFQKKRIHMAIVVDEYGGTAGLITLEDVIEEIIGEISDEFDDDEIAYNKLDNSTFIFEGKTLLNDFCKVLDIPSTTFEAVKGESESLGGLLLELHTKIPRVGEKICFDKFVFTVVAVDSRRVKRIRVFINEEKANEETK